MTWQTCILYFGTWLLVALTPGPAVFCSMGQATRHGFRSSLAGISGVQMGNFGFFVCIALGLAALLNTATSAFSVLRIAGAIYLFYLGFRMIRSQFRAENSGAAAATSAQPAHRSLFLQGLLIQVTNPKALLFVSALLPQFLDPGAPLMWQLLVLAGITIAVDAVVLASYAFFADRGVQKFREFSIGKWAGVLCGGALIYFGSRLLFSRK